MSVKKRLIRGFAPPEFDFAFEIIERELLAEQIGEEIARAIRAPITIPPVIPKIEFPSTALRFLKPHQHLTVPAGETKRVYYYKLPGDHMGVIQRVGNTYFAETKARWLVDGKEVYGVPIEREIANINNPLELRPPIMVTQRIEWTVKNESGEFDRDYHVVIDGISCHKSEFNLLLSWLKTQ